LGFNIRDTISHRLALQLAQKWTTVQHEKKIPCQSRFKFDFDERHLRIFIFFSTQRKQVRSESKARIDSHTEVVAPGIEPAGTADIVDIVGLVALDIAELVGIAVAVEVDRDNRRRVGMV
jgi:hypothetical protein